MQSCVQPEKQLTAKEHETFNILLNTSFKRIYNSCASAADDCWRSWAAPSLMGRVRNRIVIKSTWSSSMIRAECANNIYITGANRIVHYCRTPCSSHSSQMHPLNGDEVTCRWRSCMRHGRIDTISDPCLKSVVFATPIVEECHNEATGNTRDNVTDWANPNVDITRWRPPVNSVEFSHSLRSRTLLLAIAIEKATVKCHSKLRIVSQPPTRTIHG